MSQTGMQRRSFLRGSVTLAGSAVLLPGLATLGGCAQTPASLEPLMPVVDAMADRILPATDTPGALAAGVPEYVAAVFDAHLSSEQQDAILRGLTAIDDAAADSGAASFAEATPEQQDAALTAIAAREDEAGAVWQQLRDMMIFGFYTSEQAIQDLRYEAIPGRYIACLPLEEVGGAWLDRGV